MGYMEGKAYRESDLSSLRDVSSFTHTPSYESYNMSSLEYSHMHFLTFGCLFSFMNKSKNIY